MAVNVGLLAPLAYCELAKSETPGTLSLIDILHLSLVVVLVTALGIFSSIYRRRKAAEAVDSPWFPTHSARDMYITLLSTEPAPPESLIKSALLLRAMTDVKRIMKMRDDKAALSILIGKGAVGDDLLARFQRAEKELEAEILDVVNEANSFTPAWGPGIFQTASEMVAGDKLREDWTKIPHIKALEEERLLRTLGKTLPPGVTAPTTLTPTSPSTLASPASASRSSAQTVIPGSLAAAAAGIKSAGGGSQTPSLSGTASPTKATSGKSTPSKKGKKK